MALCDTSQHHSRSSLTHNSVESTFPGQKCFIYRFGWIWRSLSKIRIDFSIYVTLANRIEEPNLYKTCRQQSCWESFECKQFSIGVPIFQLSATSDIRVLPMTYWVRDNLFVHVNFEAREDIFRSFSFFYPEWYVCHLRFVQNVHLMLSKYNACKVFYGWNLCHR